MVKHATTRDPITLPMEKPESFPEFYQRRQDVIYWDGIPKWDRTAVIQFVNVELIKYSSVNPRTFVLRVDMEDLLASIAEEGIREPVRLRRANPKFDLDDDG